MIGTRPEAIKLAPVAAALRARSVEPLLIFTGQHSALDPVDHALGGYAQVRLHCAGLADPHAHVGVASKALVPVFIETAPDLVVVQGDTSSALGGALAARIVGAALGHVEAGLRSHDLRRPWPEEEFRIAIDRESDLLFAPTVLSAANLRREEIKGEVHVTGNSGVDAVLAIRRRIGSVARHERPTLFVTCHRRESWGEGLDGIAAALRRIAATGIVHVEVILHPNEAVAGQIRDRLFGVEGICLRQPMTHQETIAAMLACHLVLSDSGGMQEEAATLAIPMLVLRDKTERPEGIADGSLELVGTDPDRIVAEVSRLLKPGRLATPSLAFGDGRAGERIAAIFDIFLSSNGAGLFSEF